jgi:hypothetical protein
LDGKAGQIFGRGSVGEIEGQERFVVANVAFDNKGVFASAYGRHTKPHSEERCTEREFRTDMNIAPYQEYAGGPPALFS